MAGWCGARTTSTREPLLDMPAGACHALPGRPVLQPLEPEAARFSEIGAICRLAPRLLCEQRRTSGAVGGAESRLTPHIRLESCSPESVLQPQTRTLDVIRSPAPSTARAVLGGLRRPNGATSRRGHARATFYDKRGAIQRFLILNAPPLGLDAQLAPLFEGPDRLLQIGGSHLASLGAQRRHYQVLQAALGSVRVL